MRVQPIQWYEICFVVTTMVPLYGGGGADHYVVEAAIQCSCSPAEQHRIRRQVVYYSIPVRRGKTCVSTC